MTRRNLITLAALTLSRRLLIAQGLQIKPSADSTLTFEVRKTGLMAGKTHLLLFTLFEVTVIKEPELRVTMTIQAASLECRDAWLKEKDREKVRRYAIDELLQASQYPVLRFESSSVQPASHGYLLGGKLTIRNQSRPVTVNVVSEAKEGQTVWTGGAAIRQTDFGLKPPTAALGAIGTEDEMQLSFHLLSQPFL